MRWLALALLSACGTNDTVDASMPIDAQPDAGAIDASDPMDAAALDAEPEDTGVVAGDLPPTNAGELRPWLEAGSYTAWPAESAIHDSAGPHFGNVRTYINTVLDQSLAAGNTEHPVGSASVKELYGSGGANIRGYSVMVKTEAGSGGDRWWWYERFNATTYASSQGDGQCVPCHSAGNDHFLSPYPLQ
jgi:hypothetical protein